MSSIGCNFNQSSILVANQLYKVKHKYLDSFCFSVVFMSNKNQDALKQNNIGKCSIAVIVKNNLESSETILNLWIFQNWSNVNNLNNLDFTRSKDACIFKYHIEGPGKMYNSFPYIFHYIYIHRVCSLFLRKTYCDS